MNITRNFTWEESQVTSTGLPNAPTTDEQRRRIVHTAYEMEIVRAILGRKPVRINSWFRGPAVNKKVGGSPTSEHSLGAAVDFTCPGYGTPFEVCKAILANAHIVQFNQLIWERKGNSAWVHISFPPPGQLGKKEVLSLLNGKYTKGLVQ